MPLVGYVCPQGADEPGRRNKVDYCLHECANPCVGPSLLAAMYKADAQNYHNDVRYISASLLSGGNCVRQTRWERTVDYYELARKRFWPFRGTIAHGAVEGAYALLEPKGWLQEVRTETALEYDLAAPIFEERERALTDGELTHRALLQRLERADALKQLGEFEDLLRATGQAAEDGLRRAWLDAIEAKYAATVPTTVVERVFTGQFDHGERLVIPVRGTGDAYNPFRRLYVDKKTMADKKAAEVITGNKGGTMSKSLDDAWVWQFNIYRWLFARTAVPQEVRDRFKAYGLELKSKNYPAPTKLWMQGIGMMELPRSGTRYAYKEGYSTTVHEIDDIPVLPLHEIEEYVRPRALQWYRYLVLGMPAPVLPKDQAWKCRSCPFNAEVTGDGPCRPEAERKAKAAGKVSAA